MDKVTETSLLYDFYGQLLTEKKRQYLELYHEEDMSLSEIAEEFGVSRTAVYDSLKKAENSLKEYENKLGLVRKFLKTREAMTLIEGKLDLIIQDEQENLGLRERLTEVKEIITNLEEE